MNETLQFAQPLWIWIGLAICVALAFGMARWNRRRDRDLEKLAHSRLLKQLTESVSRKRRVLKQALWLVALFLVFVAVARPQFGFEYREVKRRGIDLVFAIDTSRSMLAEDVVPNRLERARLAVTDFVQKLEGDRVALIPFAGNAFSLCPLTLDYSAFFQSLDALDTEIIPHQGTDLATAVQEANRLFDEEGNNHRILILITDGEDLQGSVMDAVATAKEKGMTIHTVGVGDPAGALIPIMQADGSQDFVRDDAGEPVRTSLDEETLQQIARATGGIYAPLGGAGQGLETIYQEKLRLVPKSDFDQRLDQIPLERFEWPLAGAIALLFFEFLLSERRRERRRKAPVISVARRKTATAALGLFLLNGWAANAQELPEVEDPTAPVQENFDDPRAAYNAGTSAFREGEFDRAEETLSHTLGNTDDLSLQQRSYYNLGNTRYRIGQQTVDEKPDATITKWEQAVKAFEDALALNPDDEDARYNRDFVQEKLDELKRQQEEKQQQQNQQEQQKSQDQQDQDQEGQENQEQSSEDQQEGDQQEDSSDSKGESGEEDSEEKESNQGESESESESESEDEQEQEQEREDSSEKNEEGSESESENGKENEDSESGQQEEKEEDQEAEGTQPSAEERQEQEPQPGDGGEEKEEDSKEEQEVAEQPAPESSDETQEAQEEQQPGTPGSFSEERREPGEMSREEASQLLEALEKDEKSVIPLPDIQTYRRSVPNNTTRGKTW